VLVARLSVTPWFNPLEAIFLSRFRLHMGPTMTFDLSTDAGLAEACRRVLKSGGIPRGSCAMTDARDEMRSFIEQGWGIEEILQAVENALVDAGYDDFAVATERGTFRWQTVERARAEGGEQLWD
jgi:hypothetical protein